MYFFHPHINSIAYPNSVITNRNPVPEFYAAGYLTACLDEGEDVFLLGIRDVAKAQGGMTTLAKETDLNRESLYDMLSEDGNPRLKSLTKVVDSLGFKLELKRKIVGKNAA